MVPTSENGMNSTQPPGRECVKRTASVRHTTDVWCNEPVNARGTCD